MSAMTALARFALAALMFALPACSSSNKSETCTGDGGATFKVGAAYTLASCDNSGCAAYACVASGDWSCVPCGLDAGAPSDARDAGDAD